MPTQLYIGNDLEMLLNGLEMLANKLLRSSIEVRNLILNIVLGDFIIISTVFVSKNGLRFQK